MGVSDSYKNLINEMERIQFFQNLCSYLFLQKHWNAQDLTFSWYSGLSEYLISWIDLVYIVNTMAVYTKHWLASFNYKHSCIALKVDYSVVYLVV